MRQFNVPVQYQSPIVSQIKQKRKSNDKMKKDYAPTILKFGNFNIHLARHFGFCYGVENAIEIAFSAINENPGKRIFLLSEMIHNPGVNNDLLNLGVKFIMDTKGNNLIPWEDINNDDIVIIPAFGTTLELENLLKNKGINPSRYETTCPFVEKVWNRAEKIGNEGYTIVVHGKPGHEETRATFSHSKAHTPTIVIKDMNEAILLAKYINKLLPEEQFYNDFKGQYSEGFDITKDLQKIGVVNQTTMLASETQSIAEYLKKEINNYYHNLGDKKENRFADTRDTLCYATNDNQTAVIEMLHTPADFALVIGGYNSSNTSHLVELCEEKLPTYFIKDEQCLISENEIKHFDLHKYQEFTSNSYFPKKENVDILITSGASCPDALVERVIMRLCTIHNATISVEQILASLY